MERRGDLGSAGEKRAETAIQTLAMLGSRGESLAEVAHDARNMVTALALYCDLLEEPGVLAAPFFHYGSELRLVTAASRRLVEKLAALDAPAGCETSSFEPPQSPIGGTTREVNAGAAPKGIEVAAGAGLRHESPGWGRGQAAGAGRWESLFAEPVRDLAAELVSNRNLLAALAGPGIAVTVDTDGGSRPVRLSAEDLTRLLVNLVKNAAEAMPRGGRIEIALRERPASGREAARLLLTLDDTGSGIAAESLEKIFDSGFTTHPKGAARNGGWPVLHRGLGLAITRSLVESAGGRITAANRSGTHGARFTIELPVREL